MGSAKIALAGNVVTAPRMTSNEPGKERLTIRVVSNERRLDSETKEWVNSDEFGATVVCWRNLANNVLASVQVGTPVVVIGKMVSRRYEQNGEIRYIEELKAESVGLDMVRGRVCYWKPGMGQGHDVEPAATNGHEDPEFAVHEAEDGEFPGESEAGAVPALVGAPDPF